MIGYQLVVSLYPMLLILRDYEPNCKQIPIHLNAFVQRIGLFKITTKLWLPDKPLNKKLGDYNLQYLHQYQQLPQ